MIGDFFPNPSTASTPRCFAACGHFSAGPVRVPFFKAERSSVASAPAFSYANTRRQQLSRAGAALASQAAVLFLQRRQWRRRDRTRKALIQAQAEDEETVPTEELFMIDGDMVKYRLSEPSNDGLEYGLASVIENGSKLQPLCTWEAGEMTFVEDNNSEPVDAKQAVEVYQDIWMSARQLPYDVNPHGEHAEPTYTNLDEEEEFTGVFISIQPDRAPRTV
mmetsp:Transcript_2375/g.5033  ORF Transcript_2375/g.5033 Transcript_2375/m.5033 type:complete len:220 (+) Transcript_2375:91-750(+)